MALDFDATLKSMLEESPPDWPILVGQPPSRVEVIDADISTVSGATDKVLHVYGPPESIMHIDFQSGGDKLLPRRVHMYNAILEHRHGLPVRSVVVLLAPKAIRSNLTGRYQQGFPGEPAYLRFRYQVLRVWRLPVESLLAGGLGPLPLAPISAVTEANLPGVIARMKARLQRLDPEQAGRLWTMTKVLMGLRYSAALTDQLLKGIREMEESVTYQEIVAEGKAKGVKQTLLAQGQELFGTPDARVRAAFDAITDLDRLNQLSVRLLKVKSWQELLDLPRNRSRQRK
jgi:predicted transposase YdaD